MSSHSNNAAGFSSFYINTKIASTVRILCIFGGKKLPQDPLHHLPFLAFTKGERSWFVVLEETIRISLPPAVALSPGAMR